MDQLCLRKAEPSILLGCRRMLEYDERRVVWIESGKSQYGNLLAIEFVVKGFPCPHPFPIQLMFRLETGIVCCVILDACTTETLGLLRSSSLLLSLSQLARSPMLMVSSSTTIISKEAVPGSCRLRRRPKFQILEFEHWKDILLKSLTSR